MCPNIPQIFRERIASSLVGTPGVDTSGQQLGQEIAQGADAVAKPMWEVAIKQQNMKDEAEYHSLMVQHKLNLLKSAEDIKVKFVGNPDAAGPAMLEATKNSISQITQSVSNPRVKLMVGNGESLAETASLRDVYQWTAQQKMQNTVDHSAAVINDSTNRLASVGSDLNASTEDMKAKMLPEVNLLASEVAAVRIYNPELAREIEIKGMKSYYKQLIDATLDTQPEKAITLAGDPEVVKYFTSDEIKTYKNTALAAVKAFPEREMTRQIQQGMVANTELLGKVRSKELGFSGIDAMQKKDPDGETTNANFWKSAKELALGIGGTPEAADRDAIKASFVNDLSKMGIRDAKDPTRLTRKKDNKVLMGQNIEKLYKLRDDIFSAEARGIISDGEAQTYLDEIYVPLVAKTLQDHSPNFFQKLMNESEKQGGVGAIWNKFLPDKARNLQTVAGVIENHLTRDGAGEDNAKRVQFYDAYFKAKAKNLGQINSKTNAMWTPAEIARSVVGEGLGDAYQTKFGLRTITGYDKKTGSPMVELSKEDEEAISNAKALGASMKRK